MSKAMKTDFSRYYLSIPVSETMSGLCLVALHASELLCIHVFRTLYPSAPSSREMMELTPVDVLFVCRTWDFRAVEGDWNIVGHSGLNPEAFGQLWGVPAFGAINLLGCSNACRVEYGDDLVTRSEHPSSVREALRLDLDMIWGVDSVPIEIKAMLIDKEYDDQFLSLRSKRERGLDHLKGLHQ